MAVSTRKVTKELAVRDPKMSRAALEQKALEGRGRDLYKYLIKNKVLGVNDETFLYLSWLWLYCDPKKELTIDQFMELTEQEMHDRFDNLKSKAHLKKLDSFKKVTELYGIEDGEASVPHRYAL